MARVKVSTQDLNMSPLTEQSPQAGVFSYLSPRK